MVEDEEIDEVTKRILERTAKIQFTGADAKKSQGGKRAQKKMVSEPSEEWDRKDNLDSELDGLDDEDAITRIEKELEENLNDVDLWIKLGEKQYFIHRENDAIHAFKTALIREPRNKTALKKLAWCFENLNQWSDARECWENIIKEDEGDTTALSGHAYCSIQLPDLDKAVEYYSKVLDIDERNVTAVDNLGFVFYKMNKYNDAVKQFKKSLYLERKTDDVYAERFLARSYFFMESHDKECEKYVDKAIEWKTDDWYIYNIKGELLIKENKMSEAIIFLKKSVKISPEHRNLFELGICFAKQKKYQFAILYYEKALEIKRDTHTMLNLSGCYIDTKPVIDRKKSMQLADQVLEIDKGNVRALYLKIVNLIELGELNNVVTSVKEFEKQVGKPIHQKDEDEEKEENYYGARRNVICILVEAYQKLGRHDVSLEYANKLVEIEDSEVNYDWKAFVLDENGKSQDAMELCDKVIEKELGGWMIYSRKAELLVDNYPERIEEALEYYQKSIEILKKQEDGILSRKNETKEEELCIIYLQMAVARKDTGNLISKDERVDDKDDLYKSKMKKALEFTDLALENNDNSWEAWYEKGNCYWNLGNYHESLECYEKSIIINPKKVESWVCLGDVTKKLGSSSEAKYFYQKAIVVSDKKIKDKEKLQKNNTRRSYDWVDAEMGLVKCLYEERKYKDALVEIDKIFEIQKTRDEEAHRLSALCYSQLDMYGKSLKFWEMGMKDFADDKWFNGICLYNCSIDSELLGLEVDADEYAKKLINSDSDTSADGYQLQGKFLVKKEKYEEAIKVLEEHLANFSEHGKKQGLKLLIKCYDKLENKEKKEEYEKRLKELEDEN